MSRIVFSAALASILISSPSYADAFDYASSLDMNEFRSGSSNDLNGRGGTFLKFMEEQVKPAMDVLATEGYDMCDGDTVEEAYDAADKKVQGKVARFGGIDEVKSIADKLVKKLNGKKVTLATLPQEIRSVAPRAEIYDLANFYGLACGGGVKVVFAENNYSLNVHYDVSEEKSGRSFGVGPTRGANDASDKDYLTNLGKYSKASTENLKEFYRTMFESLLATDGRNFTNVEEEGQTVLTDFLAVYIAEQARNLMDGRVTPHWDAALLEVSLLAGFHAGQSTMKMYYQNPSTQETSFTSKTLKQARCEAPSTAKKADMTDYWQFSRNITDPKNCGRSGINITKKEFRKLGSDITSWIAENHSGVYERVKKSMKLTRDAQNLYESLSYYLINSKAPRKLAAKDIKEMTLAWSELLTLVTENADEITAQIEENQ